MIGTTSKKLRKTELQTERETDMCDYRAACRSQNGWLVKIKYQTCDMVSFDWLLYFESMMKIE